MRTHRFPHPLGVSVVIRPQWRLSFGPRCGESRWGSFPDYPGWLAARRRPAPSFGPRLGLVMGVTVAYALARLCRPQRAADVCATSVASRAAKVRVSKRMCGAVRTGDCTDAYVGQKLSPRTICVASVNGSARLRVGQMYGRTTDSAPNREIEHGRACCHLQQRQPPTPFRSGYRDSREPLRCGSHHGTASIRELVTRIIERSATDPAWRRRQEA